MPYQKNVTHVELKNYEETSNALITNQAQEIPNTTDKI